MKIKYLAAENNVGAFRTEPVAYIVLHGEDGKCARECAQELQRWTVGKGTHFYVDAREIWQVAPEERVALHCGSRRGYYHPHCRNQNSIGITLCRKETADPRQSYTKETVENALRMIKILREKYKLPEENILRHYDVTHAVCPPPFVRDRRQWAQLRRDMEEKDGI